MTRACSVCASPNPLDLLFCAACGASLGAGPSAPEALADGFSPLPEGTQVRDETLVLVQVLGQGGFGITYRAREISTNRTVAVKELFPFGCVRQNGEVRPSSLLDQSAWDASREGFRREGALLSNHAHPNVVQVLDVWDEKGTTFLAMEFLDGQTLAQVLEGGALSVRRVRAMIGQIAGALSLLHGAGMLHRDIKPENIMLVRDPASPNNSRSAGESERWVLLDFGAARAFASGRTMALTQIVSPGYAPLEQYASRARGGPPSDIYGLAATAYHALTGVAPPPATERASHDELRSPESLNPNIPRALSEAIVRALSLRVDGRPPSVEAWMRELDGAPPRPAPGTSSPFAAPIPPVFPPAPSSPTRSPMGPEVAAPVGVRDVLRDRPARTLDGRRRVAPARGAGRDGRHRRPARLTTPMATRAHTPVTDADIRGARPAVASVARRTPVLSSRTISERAGGLVALRPRTSSSRARSRSAAPRRSSRRSGPRAARRASSAPRRATTGRASPRRRAPGASAARSTCRPMRRSPRPRPRGARAPR
jgi:serine/threonine protein kinase